MPASHRPSSPARARHRAPATATQYAFPDAYIGQNTTLRDTMINLILQVRRNSPL